MLSHPVMQWCLHRDPSIKIRDFRCIAARKAGVFPRLRGEANVLGENHGMGNFLPFVTVLFSLQVSASAATPIGQNLPLVRFQGCYDGNTCTTTDGETVRLACIDAPEIKKPPRFRSTRMRPTAYDNSSSEQSADALRTLVLGRSVGIRRITTDRYGLTIAELFIDNRNVGQQQVRNGHAVISHRFASQCPWAKRF